MLTRGIERDVKHSCGISKCAIFLSEYAHALPQLHEHSTTRSSVLLKSCVHQSAPCTSKQIISTFQQYQEAETIHRKRLCPCTNGDESIRDHLSALAEVKKDMVLPAQCEA